MTQNILSFVTLECDDPTIVSTVSEYQHTNWVQYSRVPFPAPTGKRCKPNSATVVIWDVSPAEEVRSPCRKDGGIGREPDLCH